MPSGIKKSDIDSRNHYAFHWNCFKGISDEQAYWLGWLATDGCVTNNIVQLMINNQDKELVMRFSNFIGSKSINFNSLNNSCLTKMRSDIMAERLISLGITERKTFTLNITHPILIKSSLFWRGCFEGDGSLHYSTTWRFKLTSASYIFLQQWCDFIKLPYTYIYKEKNYYIFHIKKKSEVLKILKILYKDSTQQLRLERKWELVRRCIYLLDDSCLPGTFNLG
jgi:hypothetical protein